MRSSPDTVYPSLGVGVARGTRYAKAWPILTGRYQPCDTEPSVLRAVIREHAPPKVSRRDGQSRGRRARRAATVPAEMTGVS